MNVRIRPVDFASDRERLTAVLQRNLGDLDHARRFQWLYQKNPAGRAWSWFAYESKSDNVVGVASLIPRDVWMAGHIVRCGQVGDFAIDSGFRSLGPALMLQKATFGPVNSGHLSFCYDCPPHAAGMSTFQRLGMKPVCRLERFVRLLRLDRIFAQKIGPGILSKTLALAGNSALPYLFTARVSKSVQIKVLTTPFDEEFTRLDKELRAFNTTVQYCRSAADLNWRFREDPLRRYEVLTAREHGSLQGFLVFFRAGKDISIVDIFARPAQGVVEALVGALIKQVRNESIESLQFSVSERHPHRVALMNSGFRVRSVAAAVVVYSGAASDRASKLPPESWALTHADAMA